MVYPWGLLEENNVPSQYNSESLQDSQPGDLSQNEFDDEDPKGEDNDEDLFDISVVLHQKEDFHIFERSCIFYLKGWPAIAKLKPTFTLLGRDFAVFNTFTYQNPYQEKWKLILD